MEVARIKTWTRNRTVTVVRKCCVHPGIIRITADGKSRYYKVRTIPCDIGGIGWEVSKLGSAVDYYVQIGDNSQDVRCDCIACEATGDCRHIRSLLAVGSALLAG